LLVRKLRFSIRAKYKLECRMVTTLFASPEATIEDLAQLPDNVKAELVNGKLVIAPATLTIRPSIIAVRLPKLNPHSQAGAFPWTPSTQI
jgi:hypothetical protein